MNLIEKLNSINHPKIPTLSLGRAYSMDELREKLLNMYKVDKKIVLKWHKLLMDYVNMDLPMFAIRGYNSFPKEKYDCLRRGFLTMTERFSYFYTDNYFAAYFLKMCLDGYVPDISEFYELMTTRQFPSRFGQITSQEKELMAINQGKDPGINLAGYKLAHIIPVGKAYLIDGKEMGMQEILTRFFPLGQRSEWKLYSDNFGVYNMRKLHEISPATKKVAVAHFLRFVHPFNYFICPKQKCEANNMCNDLAEYQPLLNNMHDYMLQTYGEAYKEFLSYILVDEMYGKEMYEGDTGIKVAYGRILENAPVMKLLLREMLVGTDSDTIFKTWPTPKVVEKNIYEYSETKQSQVNTFSPPQKRPTNEPQIKFGARGETHRWTYYEDEFCVRMVFYYYVYHNNHDVKSVVDEIYDHLNGVIKASSIHMKLSNIKYVLDEIEISNSLTVKSLSQVSRQCRQAITRVYAEYIKNGHHINHPIYQSPPTSQLYETSPMERPTFKIRVTEDGVVRYYKHDTKNSDKNLIEGKISYMLATPLYEIESKLWANELKKQYPNATVEIVKNVTE